MSQGQCPPSRATTLAEAESRKDEASALLLPRQHRLSRASVCLARLPRPALAVGPLVLLVMFVLAGGNYALEDLDEDAGENAQYAKIFRLI